MIIGKHIERENILKEGKMKSIMIRNNINNIERKKDEEHYDYWKKY